MRLRAQGDVLTVGGQGPGEPAAEPPWGWGGLCHRRLALGGGEDRQGASEPGGICTGSRLGGGLKVGRGP